MNSEQMTVFYSLATGSILSAASGNQDMSFYGTEAENFALSISFIHVPFDMEIFTSASNFVVDLQTKTLKFSRAVLEKYGGKR